MIFVSIVDVVLVFAAADVVVITAAAVANVIVNVVIGLYACMCVCVDFINVLAESAD